MGRWVPSRSRGPHRSGLTLVRRSRAAALLGGITLFAVALFAGVAWFAPDTGSAQGPQAKPSAAADAPTPPDASPSAATSHDAASPPSATPFGSLLACADHRRKGDGGTGRPHEERQGCTQAGRQGQALTRIPNAANAPVRREGVPNLDRVARRRAVRLAHHRMAAHPPYDGTHAGTVGSRTGRAKARRPQPRSKSGPVRVRPRPAPVCEEREEHQGRTGQRHVCPLYQRRGVGAQLASLFQVTPPAAAGAWALDAHSLLSHSSCSGSMRLPFWARSPNQEA